MHACMPMCVFLSLLASHKVISISRTPPFFPPLFSTRSSPPQTAKLKGPVCEARQAIMPGYYAETFCITVSGLLAAIFGLVIFLFEYCYGLPHSRMSRRKIPFRGKTKALGK